ncbi:TonB-dependent receptor, partial [bacterium]|nr:TonB-dependent receptor [bacterium]
MVSRIQSALSLICLLCGISLAQQTTGNIEGRLVDAKNKPISLANIVVSGPSLQGERGAASDRHGTFRVLALPVGSYSVKISHIAHHEIAYKNIAVRLGKTTTLGEVELQPRTLELAEVVVTSPKPLIDPNSTTVGTNLTAETFEQLPTERSYQSIIALSPQANTSFLGDDVNISGSTGLENIYFIDGVNVTDAYVGAGGTGLPYNFVKEVEVKAGGYEAEFGRALGGITNVITYSGSNKFEAKAFGFFTDNRFAGQRELGFIDFRTDAFSRYDAGVSLGGPLVRDKLWFFLAYNVNVEKEDIAFEGLGVETDKRIANIFAGKLTWQAAQNANIVFTVFGDPTNWDRIGHNSPGANVPSRLA